MDALIFTPVDDDSLCILQRWYDTEELPHRMERATKIWLDYVTHDADAFGWMIYEKTLCVGHIALDRLPDRIGCFGFAVNPPLRNRGYGKRLLRALLQRPELEEIDEIKVGVENDHIASQRCLVAAGFQQKVPQAADLEFVPNQRYLLFVYAKSLQP